MSEGQKKREIDFATKRRSLLHTYDSFLTAQTRIFTLAHYVYAGQWGDVENQQEQLFFDDFLSFGITARRLIELTGVKSFANHVAINEQHFDDTVSPIAIRPLGTKIGFLKFANCIVHAKYVELIRSRFDLWSHRRLSASEKDVVAQYNLLEKVRRENRWPEYAIDVSVIVVTDSDELTMVRLKDAIEASTKVIDKVVERCDDAGIYLELDFRKMD